MFVIFFVLEASSKQSFLLRQSRPVSFVSLRRVAFLCWEKEFILLFIYF